MSASRIRGVLTCWGQVGGARASRLWVVTEAWISSGKGKKKEGRMEWGKWSPGIFSTCFSWLFVVLLHLPLKFLPLWINLGPMWVCLCCSPWFPGSPTKSKECACLLWIKPTESNYWLQSQWLGTNWFWLKSEEPLRVPKQFKEHRGTWPCSPDAYKKEGINCLVV